MRLVDINAEMSAPLADGVGEAWVMDPRARRANSAALDGLPDADPRIRPYLVAMPGPLADLERRVAAHRDAGGPAVIRICPGPEGHGYPLEPWAVSPIPEYCEREDLALVVDVEARASGYPWSEIVRFARNYPSLTVVALAAPLDGPTASRALDATPNLLLETSSMTGASPATAFAELVRTRGAYRIVYGSGAAHAPVSAVVNGLSPADSDTILAGTANHLANGTWRATYL